MRKLLQHVSLLPGRALVRRKAGHWWGEVVQAPGYASGTRVSIDHVEATFQKGKSHYAVVFIGKIHRI